MRAPNCPAEPVSLATPRRAPRSCCALLAFLARGRSRLGAAPRRGLTLIELLLTVAVLGILAAVLIPQISSDLPERLQAAAQVVSADLDYARSLAVAQNSRYRLTFEPAENRYFLRHSGVNSLLDVLPRSAFRQPDDPPEQQTTDLDRLPLPAPAVRLVAVLRMQGGGQSTAELEFTPQGATTSVYPTVVWLACGHGANERFLSVTVHPITGLSEIGALQSALPAGAVAVAAQNSSQVLAENN